MAMARRPVDDYVGAFGGEAQGDAAADAFGGAGD
jgi:hypothetical protein